MYFFPCVFLLCCFVWGFLIAPFFLFSYSFYFSNCSFLLNLSRCDGVNRRIVLFFSLKHLPFPKLPEECFTKRSVVTSPFLYHKENAENYDGNVKRKPFIRHCPTSTKNDFLSSSTDIFHWTGPD